MPEPYSIEREYERLELENYNLRRENAALRQMIPLLKTRLDAFLLWFQGTINSIH